MPQSARRSTTDCRSCKETQTLQLCVQDVQESKCCLLPGQLMLCRPAITITCLELLVACFYCAERKSSSAAVLNLSPNKYFSFHSPQGTEHSYIPKLGAHGQRDCPVLSIAHTAIHCQGSFLPFEADSKAYSPSRLLSCTGRV